MDFAVTAIFTALAVTMWRGKRDVLPWVVAAGVALAAHRMLPGAWYVLLGGVAGAFTLNALGGSDQLSVNGTQAAETIAVTREAVPGSALAERYGWNPPTEADAARRIVQIAAPYAPFPAAVA